MHFSIVFDVLPRGGGPLPRIHLCVNHIPLTIIRCGVGNPFFENIFYWDLRGTPNSCKLTPAGNCFVGVCDSAVQPALTRFDALEPFSAVATGLAEAVRDARFIGKAVGTLRLLGHLGGDGRQQRVQAAGM